MRVGIHLVKSLWIERSRIQAMHSRYTGSAAARLHWIPTEACDFPCCSSSSFACLATSKARSAMLQIREGRTYLSHELCVCVFHARICICVCTWVVCVCVCVSIVCARVSSVYLCLCLCTCTSMWLVMCLHACVQCVCGSAYVQCVFMLVCLLHVHSCEYSTQ